MQNLPDQMENDGNSSDTAMELPGEMSETRYFTERFDALMEKYKFETDQNALSLRKKVVSWLNGSIVPEREPTNRSEAVDFDGCYGGE